MVVGLSESEKEAILERHMADVAMQQDAREQERRRQREMLEVSCLNNTASTSEKKNKSTPGLSSDFSLNFGLINSDLTICNS